MKFSALKFLKTEITQKEDIIKYDLKILELKNNNKTKEIDALKTGFIFINLIFYFKINYF